MNKAHKRLLFLALFVFALLSLLVVQFFRIQIMEGNKWSKRADKQHYLVITEPYKRGKFISNTSIKRAHPEIPQSFVIDIPKYHLHIDPNSIPIENRDAISNFLMGQLELTISERIRFRGQFERRSRDRKLAMWLDEETRNRIKSWWESYARKNKIAKNALFFVSDYQRSYPFGKLLGQVLHTIQCNKDEVTQCAIPTGGLELYFKKYLEGKSGKRRLMRSPRNSLATGTVISRPINGADIHLTINHCLQAIAEEELEKGVKDCNAKGGWAVMMNPHTGEILALAQYPFFNPTQYQWYFNNPDYIDHTRVRAITDAQEPGSVMKPITAAVAFQASEVLKNRGEKPLITFEEKVPTLHRPFPGRKKELKDLRPHKFLNFEMAMQKSSNVYFATLYLRVVEKLGNQWLRQSLSQMFGLGAKTNIELPSETTGVLPMPGKLHPNGALEWSAGTPYTLAMGHNIQVSSMQLLRAYAVFANGGYLVQPTIVRKIVRANDNGTEEIIIDNTKPRTFPRVLEPEIAKRIVRAMKFVTKQGGTSIRANVFGFSEAGKSGTANKIEKGSYSEKNYCSSFVGFTPVENPSFVLVVTMDEPQYGYIPGVGKRHHGGTCAAPVFREISRRSLEYLGVTPDDPFGYPPNDPRYDHDKADWIIETEKLKEMYEKWNN